MNKKARIKVKFCGMRRLIDVNLAVSLGVDALGFIFYPKSSRFIEVAEAKALVADLPPFIAKVGVFVNAEKSEVLQAIGELGLDYCQFHGDESSGFCRQFTIPYFKAVRVKERQSIIEAVQQYHDASALLLDTYVNGVRGGTGIAFDWSMIPSTTMPLILAGGIDVDNAGEAMRTECYAIDVCSGIEQAPGVKNKTKMNQLMQTVWSSYDAIS